MILSPLNISSPNPVTGNSKTIKPVLQEGAFSNFVKSQLQHLGLYSSTEEPVGIKFYDDDLLFGPKLNLSLGSLYQKKTRTASGSELLIRALGKDITDCTLILDLTAGFALDANLIAGYFPNKKVVCFEHHKSLACMLYFASFKGWLKPNVEIFYQNNLNFTDQVAKNTPFIVYLDPMFIKQKSSKANKYVELLKTFNEGEDELQQQAHYLALKQKALEWGAKRLIVKRSAKLKPLLEGPTYSLRSNLIRFDIYQSNG